MKKCRIAILIICLLIDITVAIAQSNSQPQAMIHGNVILKGMVVDGDTLPHIRLREVVIMPRIHFRSKRAVARYSRLVHNVKKALPYARLAAAKIYEIEDSLSRIENSDDKKAYLKSAEKSLFAEFEKPLRKLTVSQGRILIKLIDRETGSTSYALIKQFKGKFSAFLWQSVARIFGSSLKSEYDIEGEDKLIEYIVNQIDNGEI